MISEPTAIAEIFRDTGELRSGEGNRVFEPMLGKRSLLVMDGAEHRRERKLLMPMFHGERMRAYADTMLRVAHEQLDRWPESGRLSIHPEMQSIALDVILAAVFGLERSERQALLRAALVHVLDMTAGASGFFAMIAIGERGVGRLSRALGPYSPIGMLRKRLEPINALLVEEFQERRARPQQQDDILSLMMEARDEAGQSLDDQHLRDEMLTLLAAGHETTATALSWTLYRLARHTEIADEARAELDRVTSGAALSADHTRKLPYLDAVVKESLRLHPIVPFVVRKLVDDRQFGRWSLPAGSLVCPSIWLTHRRPDLWPHPDRFEPERFLDTKISNASYLPFGGGNRTCLGLAFAQLEMRIVLAAVLTKFNLALADDYHPRVARRGVTFAPSGGCPLVVRQR